MFFLSSLIIPSLHACICYDKIDLSGLLIHIHTYRRHIEYACPSDVFEVHRMILLENMLRICRFEDRNVLF